MCWLTPTPEGTPPSPRMGCSAAFLPARHRGAASHIVLLGGCDGNDLLRNGEDYFGSVHVLTFVPDGDMPRRLREGDGPLLKWSQPSVLGEMPSRMAGRCHVMEPVGGRLICFGGGANISSMLVRPWPLRSRPS